MEANFTHNITQIPQHDYFNSPALLPAIFTLVCFICTVMSLTVAGFICLRDKEAKDENEIIIRQQREDEFVSKAVSLFYNIRTSNVFRINEIVEDKNENRPAWLSSKDEVIKSLQVYGICLTENEDKEISSLSDIFEVDTEALLYLELERFAKAIATYGEDTMRYFPSIPQDGVVFRTQFIEEKKEIYEGQLIYTLFREMKQITDLFVLLLTGIDAGFLSSQKLPKQFQMCLMKDELCLLEDFFYNYYQRLYSQKTFRPDSNIVQSMHVLQLQNKRLAAATSPEITTFEDDSFGDIEQKRSVMSRFRQTYQAVRAAQRLASRRRRPSVSPTESKATQEQQQQPIQQQQQPQQQQQLQLQQQHLEVIPHASSEPSIPDIIVEEEPTDFTTTPLSSSYNQYRQPKPDLQLEKQRSFESQMQKAAPKLVRSPWSTRKRGKLKRKVPLEKNPFTYMIFKVLECLKGNAVDEKKYEVKEYNQVDRNFII